MPSHLSLFGRCEVNFLTWFQAYVRFFPVFTLAHTLASALCFAFNINRSNFFNFNLENKFNGSLDF